MSTPELARVSLMFRVVLAWLHVHVLVVLVVLEIVVVVVLLAI